MKSATRPSKVTVPPRAHPLARLVFRLMRDTRTTYDELEMQSGVLRSTFKAWRTSNLPSMASLEAALGSFGWRIVPCPPIDGLPDEVRDKLDEVGQHFCSDDETLAAAIFAAISKAGVRDSDERPTSSPVGYGGWVSGP
jgi:hypothetical protein